MFRMNRKLFFCHTFNLLLVISVLFSRLSSQQFASRTEKKEEIMENNHINIQAAM